MRGRVRDAIGFREVGETALRVEAADTLSRAGVEILGAGNRRRIFASLASDAAAYLQGATIDRERR